MRRLLGASMIAAAALLALPAAVYAAPLHGSGAPAGIATGRTEVRAASAAGPLRLPAEGAPTVTVTVLTFDGSPEPAVVQGIVQADPGYAGSDVPTDAAGVAQLAGLPEAAGNGELLVTPAAGSARYDVWGLSWPAAGPAGFVLQPGIAPVVITASRDAYFNGWRRASVALSADAVTGGAHSSATINLLRATAAPSASGNAAAISTGAATLTGGTVHYWPNEGAELAVAGTAVAPGQATASTLAVNEADAHAVWTSGWGSGRPGTVTTLVFDRFPSEWVSTTQGQATYPATAPTKSLNPWTGSGIKRVTIPSTVKPGYAYRFTVAHKTGPLVLTTWFQTCSLVAGKTSIHRGGAIRLSGVIPTEGHFGPAPGKAPKGVVLYRRTKTAGQPRTWDATRSGWRRVASLTADRYGRFRSALLRPATTSWYVLRYAGDGVYWGGYTSVRKVTVR